LKEKEKNEVRKKEPKVTYLKRTFKEKKEKEKEASIVTEIGSNNIFFFPKGITIIHNNLFFLFGGGLIGTIHV
jgi:hypothetical protein